MVVNNVPTLEIATGMGPNLPLEEEKSEETMDTAQVTMDNNQGIFIGCSTVGIGSSNTAEASATVAETPSKVVLYKYRMGGNPYKMNEYDIKIILRKIRIYVSSTTHT